VAREEIFLREGTVFFRKSFLCVDKHSIYIPVKNCCKVCPGFCKVFLSALYVQRVQDAERPSFRAAFLLV
jgi:hypothetical protein